MLTEDARVEVWAEWMRVAVRPVAALKTQVRACVDVADGWVGENLAGLTNALPASMRADARPLIILGNIVEIARGSRPGDLSNGIGADNPADQFDAYNAARTWFSDNAAGYLALATDLALAPAQCFHILEMVIRKGF
jgi:hypothetical protein